MLPFGYFLTVFGALDFFSTHFADHYVLPRVAVMLAGILLIWLAHLRAGGEAVPQTPLDRPLLVLAVVLGICAALSRDLHLSLVGPHMSQFYSVLAFLVVAGAYYAARFCHDAPWDRQLIVDINPLGAGRVMLVLAVPMCVYGLGQAAGYDPLSSLLSPSGRIIATQGSPVYLGAVLAVLAPIALHFFNEDKLSDVALGALSLLLIAAALFLTHTRGAWLAAAAGGAVYIFLCTTPGQRERGFWYAVAIAAIAVLAVLAGRGGSLGSDVGRIEVWRGALAIFAENPWFGSGPDTFAQAFRAHIGPAFIGYMRTATMTSSDAHNDVLQVAATMGLAGLAAYVFLIVGVLQTLRESFRSPWDRRDTAMVAGAAAALFVVAKLNPVPLAAVVLVALLIGALPTPCNRPATPDLLPPLGAVALVLLLVGMVPMLGAEWHQRKAVEAAHDPVVSAVEYNRAAQLNPYDIFYTMKQVEFLHGVLPLAPQESWPAMARTSVVLSKRATVIHPNEPDAHGLLGRSYAILALLTLGGTDGHSHNYAVASQAAYYRAHQLAPTFPGFLYGLVGVGTHLGDTASLTASRQQLDYLGRAEASQP